MASDDVLHSIECDCQECLDKWEKVEEPISNEIVFCADKNEWVMKLTPKGIFFNREKYPDAKSYDFALSVIEILEKEFSVKFEKKNPPYNR